MHNKIAAAVRLKYPPVALIWSNEKPEGAMEFTEGRWGCVMALVSSAAKGKICAAKRETVGCAGGAIGMGFTATYQTMPGGTTIDQFLSTGNPDILGTEDGRQMAERNPDIAKGERYMKTPALAREFVESLPRREIPTKYILIKPLDKVDEGEDIRSVVFLANPDQLSALIVLANYFQYGNNNVMVPQGAGCQQIGILTYEQGESDEPKAIIGLTDLSARKITDKSLGRDILTFSVPYKMFKEMDKNVEGSFLERDTWKEVMAES
jgi:uncharacterized protein (DUF169 family)